MQASPCRRAWGILGMTHTLPKFTGEEQSGLSPMTDQHVKYTQKGIAKRVCRKASNEWERLETGASAPFLMGRCSGTDADDPSRGAMSNPGHGKWTTFPKQGCFLQISSAQGIVCVWLGKAFLVCPWYICSGTTKRPSVSRGVNPVLKLTTDTFYELELCTSLLHTTGMECTCYIDIYTCTSSQKKHVRMEGNEAEPADCQCLQRYLL